MVEPELTEVGELHSLTDWQVSDASEEAELDEFCRGVGGGRATHEGNQRRTKPPEIIIQRKEEGRGGEGTYRDRDGHTEEGE